ncbi:phosphatidate cytidylyltransferase [Geomicrobium halophilum]|uniref:Phosphatidate cytidylyltransferase n=1 Tax=Geomicrobium halophilum TaxID=549000 RepID=A0A841PK80_9BACL|nr:phosphatidate cytidylyltransferase [Geomicrobium halophilum]MBB6449277.1 phosphatidate cytidylyltransferase [Geomicrobium halophilum]
MKLRIFTALIGLIVLLIPLILGGPIFGALVTLMTIAGLIELLRMNKISIVSFPAFLGGIVSLLLLYAGPAAGMLSNEVTFAILVMVVWLLLLTMVFSNNRYHFGAIAFIAFAAIYVGIGFHFFLAARLHNGLEYVFFVLITVWATDTGAYVFGRKFGKHKLWSAISPKKTIEGALGGIILALVAGTIYALIWSPFDYLGVTIALIIMISLAGQCGDLIESAFKRYYNVKDSGRLLPGHGGVLDRFDSLIFVFPLLYVVTVFFTS